LSEFYGIERVEFGSLNVYSNTSLADAAHYVDRTCNQRTSVTAGEQVQIRITASYENPAQIRVYCDYNANGLFELPGEQMLSGFGGILEDGVQIPASDVALCTPIRMRVVVDVPDAPEPTPCVLAGTLASGVGQIEDFTLTVLPREVSSVTSGSWHDPSVWSCNCIPGPEDGVKINSGHIISVQQGSGETFCAVLSIQPGGQLEVGDSVAVFSTCD
jgi:hypothetical protein